MSEFSYGFGVTRETLALLNSVGLSPTPFLPNLLHEEIDFDVGFKDKGRVVILQFKLGPLLQRFKPASPRTASAAWRQSSDWSQGAQLLFVTDRGELLKLIR